MFCEVVDLNTPDARFWKKVQERANREQIPIMGGIELTSRCNLACRYCYIHTPEARIENELSPARLHRLVDELTAAGNLFVVVTGGEPLLHPAFAELYRHMRSNGLYVIVFTNGTLVDDAVVRLFQDQPPLDVEITLYGVTAATYENTTQVPGSHARCLDAIYRLRAAGVPLTLKCIATTLNVHEYPKIEDFAAQLGVPFRFDVLLAPSRAGDPSGQSFRLPPDQAHALEFRRPERVAELCDVFARRSRQPRVPQLYQCAAGRSTFYVDCDGFLRPCGAARHLGYALENMDFKPAWRRMAVDMANLKIPEKLPCLQCANIATCKYCPPRLGFERGESGGPAPYDCRIGTLRGERARMLLKEKGVRT